MSRFICSAVLALILLSAEAQEKKQEEVKVPVTKAGLKIGVDMARYAFQIFDPNVQGLEIVSQYEVLHRMLVSAEGGFETVRPELPNYEYALSGYYGRLGVDYDLLGNVDDFDVVFVGLRYGMSFYNQESSDVPIESYWGNQVIDLEREELQAQWMEVVFGINAELFFARNLYLGWTMRGKFFASGNEYEVITPYSIPGFSTEEKDFALGVTWALMYHIPLK